MSGPVENNLYLRIKDEDVLATLLTPTAEVQSTAVLIVPPFGWDAVGSHRPRRRWAEALAGAGYPTVRIDLPGTEDSAGGPRDADRVESWTEAVIATTAWLLHRTEARRVAVIGPAMGGLVAAVAAARAPWITDLVLWGVPSRGRAIIREMQAFAALQGDGSFWIPSPPPPKEEVSVAADEMPDYGMVVNGHLLGDPAVADLSALDLGKIEWAARPGARALLLERDGRAPDARLVAALAGTTWTVTQAAGAGYADMMAEPQHAQMPAEVVRTVSSWLRDAPLDEPVAPEARAAAGVVAAEVEERDHLALPGLTERPIEFGVAGRTLRGILCQPDVPQTRACAVFLSSGAIRHSGPNRTWVEAARRWAAQGVASVRVDALGVGDSDGADDMYRGPDSMFRIPGLRDDTVAILDAMEQRGIASEFMLIGLCSGAFWAFGAADGDPRVRGVVLVNPWALHWDADLQRGRDIRKAVLLISRRENIEWAIPFLRSTLPTFLLRLPLVLFRRWRRSRRNLASLDAFSDRGVPLRIDLSVGEPLWADLQRAGVVGGSQRWPNLTLKQVPEPDHTFRSLALQRRMHTGFDETLAAVLASEPPPG